MQVDNYYSTTLYAVDRQIQIRGEEKAARQTWRKDGRGWLLISSLLRKGTKKAAGKALCPVVADEALPMTLHSSKRAGSMQEPFGNALQTRETAQADAAAGAGAAAAAGTGKAAAVALSDPLTAAALGGGTRSGAKSEEHSEASRQTNMRLAADILGPLTGTKDMTPAINIR
ncbi:unnamed protein product, partial [Ectocarpus fasciculatus]